MPPVIAIIAAVAAAAASYGGAAFAVYIGFQAGSLGAALIAGAFAAIAGAAVAYIGNALFGPARQKNTAQVSSERTVQSRQAITNHRIIYGRVRVSGPVVFMHTNTEARSSYTSQVTYNAATGSTTAANYAKQALFYLVHVLAAHEIDAVETVYLDSRLLSDSRYKGLAYVGPVLGTADQAAPAWLVTETDGKWTADHRARGRALLCSVLKYDQSVYSNGIPNVSAIVRGRLVFDPRLGITAWSQNPALIIADYLTAPFGVNADWDEIDLPTLIASANICDEVLTLANGVETRYRYTCNGTIDLDDAHPPETVLDQLRSSMAGSVVMSGGKWLIIAAGYQAPTETITEDDLRGAVVVTANRPGRDLFNCVRATYVRPAASWQEVDAPVLYGTPYIAADNGERKFIDLDLPFTTDGYEAQRLMKIALLRNRAQRSIKAPMNLKGLRLRCMDVVTLTLPRLPAATYRVPSWQLSADGGVDVTLEQDSPDIYAWDAATEQQDLGTVATADVPDGFSLSAPVVTVTTPTAAVPSSVTATWPAVSGATSYDWSWRLAGVSVWTDSTTTGTSASPTTGGRAAFRVRARNSDGAVSEWGFADFPGPAIATADDFGADISVGFTLNTGSVRMQLFTSSGSTFSAATLHGTEPSVSPYLITGASITTTNVWAREVSSNGNIGDEFAPLLPIYTGGFTPDGGGS